MKSTAVSTPTQLRRNYITEEKRSIVNHTLGCVLPVIIPGQQALFIRSNLRGLVHAQGLGPPMRAPGRGVDPRGQVHLHTARPGRRGLVDGRQAV